MNITVESPFEQDTRQGQQTTPSILTLCGKTNDSPQQQGGIFALISVDAFC